MGGSSDPSTAPIQACDSGAALQIPLSFECTASVTKDGTANTSETSLFGLPIERGWPRDNQTPEETAAVMAQRVASHYLRWLAEGPTIYWPVPISQPSKWTPLYTLRFFSVLEEPPAPPPLTAFGPRTSLVLPFPFISSIPPLRLLTLGAPSLTHGQRSSEVAMPILGGMMGGRLVYREGGGVGSVTNGRMVFGCGFVESRWFRRRESAGQIAIEDGDDKRAEDQKGGDGGGGLIPMPIPADGEPTPPEEEETPQRRRALASQKGMEVGSFELETRLEGYQSPLVKLGGGIGVDWLKAIYERTQLPLHQRMLRKFHRYVHDTLPVNFVARLKGPPPFDLY